MQENFRLFLDITKYDFKIYFMNAYIVAGTRSAVGKAKRGGFRFTRPGTPSGRSDQTPGGFAAEF
ncbi:MAG: hypothetical protein ACXVB0_12915 [Mucilaginibacter sp.]